MLHFLRVGLLVVLVGSLFALARQGTRDYELLPAPKASPIASVEVVDGPVLQMDRGVAGTIDAVAFNSADGKFRGWKVTIPGNRPLATPAVVDGKVYVGGGFGSHEFYAFNAQTGVKEWEYKTGDDGPTAAVVENGYVAFNTESCELEILTVDGKPVWKKWLGDPLMSIPALGKGKVYMAYPNSKGDSKYYLACFDVKTGQENWKQPIAAEIITTPVLADGHVYLSTLEGTIYCFQQKAGDLVWSKKNNATSSPVVWKGECYFSRRKEVQMAGVSQAGQADGAIRALEQRESLGFTTNNAVLQNNFAAMQVYGRPRAESIYGATGGAGGPVAAPAPAGGTFTGGTWTGTYTGGTYDTTTGTYTPHTGALLTGGTYTTKDGTVITGGTYTTTAPVKLADAIKDKEVAVTERKALYLDAAKRQASSKQEMLNNNADAGVGFGGAAKGSFNPDRATNIGQNTVAGVWAYQGSKPFVANNWLFSSMGDTLTCVDPKTEQLMWKKTLRPKNSKPEDHLDSTLTPPALVNGKVFVGTTYGQLLCLSEATGEMLWSVTIGEPIQFQPAVANGRVYVSTATGHLYCIETGDSRDDGWLMWGANAGHNGLLK